MFELQLLTLFLCSLTAGLCIGLLIKTRKNSDSNATNSKLDVLNRDVVTLSARIDEIRKGNEFLAGTVETKLKEIREDNGKQLSEMRTTVEEKLQSTLETRLTSTFKTVSDQLENVYKQLGEMQTLAKGVNNLEKVLANVKTRGMWGELQAEKILQEILTPDQYIKNARIKRNSQESVEFAVKLPGTEEGQVVLMPIDSKFPLEDYERLCDASAKGDLISASDARKNLEIRIKNEAKEIHSKYIDVPKTTDFAVLFLPIEGLYAEILAIPGLQNHIQHDYHVMVAGPTTLASLLNSLQMGFRTLAIEKKSAEVWHVLGQVKTQFFKFEDVLEKVQEKLNQASGAVDQALNRNKQLGKKLNSVEAIEFDDSDTLLDSDNN